MLLEPNELVKLLYKEGMTQSQIRAYLDSAMESLHSNSFKEAYREFKVASATLFSSMKEEMLPGEHYDLDFLSALEIDVVFSSFKKFSEEYRELNDISNASRDDDLAKILSSLGIGSRTFRNHTLPEEVKRTVEGYNSVNFGSDYSIPLNVDQLFIVDENTDLTGYHLSYQGLFMEDEKNYMIVTKDIILVSIDHEIYTFRMVEKSHTDSVDCLDLELLDIPEEHKDEKWHKVESNNILVSIKLGTIEQGDVCNHLRVTKEPIIGIVADLNAPAGNYRLIITPVYLWDDARYFVENIGFIGGKPAYVSFGSAYRFDWEMTDYIPEATYFTDARDFAFYNPRDFIVADHQLVKPKHNTFLRSDIPSLDQFGFKDEHEKDAIRHLASKGIETASPKIRWVRHVKVTPSDNFEIIKEILSSKKLI